MKINKFVFSIFLLLIFSTTFAIDVERNIHYDQDMMGRGGAGLASVEGVSMLFANPAALGVKKYKTFILLKVAAKANYDLYNLYNIYNTIGDNYDFSKLSPDQWKTLLNLKVNFGLPGPVALGYIGHGLGLYLYDDFQTSMYAYQAPGLPYFNFSTILDAGFRVSYGFELPSPVFLGKYSHLYAGLTLHYLNRAKYENTRMSALEAFDLGSSLINFSKGLFMGQDIGADMGLLATFDHLSVALVIRNWFSTGFSWAEYDGNFNKISTTNMGTSFFPAAMDIGAKYRLGRHDTGLLAMSFYFDVKNVLGFSENYWLKTRMGVETRLLRFLILRAGLYKGYPTLGVGIDIPVLKINATYFTEELGNYPGQLPEQNLMFELKLQI